jgi:hypothetical protein
MQMTNKQFIPEYVDISDGQLETADIDFWNVEGNPVVVVYDGKTGMIALFGKTRKFPVDSAFRNGREVERNEFLSTFPQTRRYFEQAQRKQATA